MDNRNKFQEMLGDILDVAKVQGNQLELNEIKKFFGDMDLNEVQYEHIFAYLAANHISVKGYVNKSMDYTKEISLYAREVKAAEMQTEDDENTKEQNFDEKNIEEDNDYPSKKAEKEEESNFVKMYLEDLNGIKEISGEEEDKLFRQIKEGDFTAKSRYIEANLRYVVKIAKEYKNQGITMEDLIQEGNMGLMGSMEKINQAEAAMSAKDFITKFIREAIEDAILEQKESKSFEGRVADTMKLIQDAADELADDLGRKANIHELAVYLNKPEEEIAHYLNMAADAVKVGHKHNTLGQVKEIRRKKNHKVD